MTENSKNNGFRRKVKPLNMNAYYPKLKEYCDKHFKVVREDRNFGKNKGLVFVLPNKNWAVLYDPTDEGFKKNRSEMILTRWMEVDPKSKEKVSANKTVVDLIAMEKNVENTKENFYSVLRPALIAEFGRYHAEQKSIHSEKYDKVKAEEQEKLNR